MKPENPDKIELMTDLRHIIDEAASQAVGCAARAPLASPMEGECILAHSLDSIRRNLVFHKNEFNPMYLGLAKGELVTMAATALRMAVMIDNHLNDSTVRKPRKPFA